ncbi:response regulator transcription factor [Paraburkholderia kirstenboschensis]|jgi:FixJ family two-component response regulator|uniref:Response regulator n=1 Tax=Paraburkholderia kirstenboschensis TaxID=1245436 RepID=A0ABZ0EAV2_9BURK|nr:response regulator [Paraburkholderia kirstenboschensis]WOD13343.1 response regulator [Paraburkholderia kirstenboschensis]
MDPLQLVSIVDDDQSVRVATESLVHSLGWPTRTFDSAEAYLQSRPPAGTDATGCLISDVRMPGMSGIEMFEHLLALGAAPPTLLMTAFPTDALRARVAAVGALALLEKPLDVAALERHLTRVLGTP